MADQTKGYFGIGVERISKPMNLGNLFRSAHAFGASFLFTIEAATKIGRPRSDTSASADSLPTWHYNSPGDLSLPEDCTLVAIELVDDAQVLPSFRHPRRAAYVFGPEIGSLSLEVLARADSVVQIPTRFCINLAAAGVVVMYDRLISLGRFAERPVSEHAQAVPLAPPVHGDKIKHSGRRQNV
ncbi:MAG: RNA methyltransferase [Alphaproteobacteria bacterium]|nr:RNA methyltransferase [Alphaproteobacteria bacterium]MDP6238714.1 RNA methyltransferase [Alphaproteobacteria bacterium]|tara:strand:+ start:8023 stop:8574 length:552 start_codon:yes stop_codon:yes gene_type:complete